MYSWGDDLEDWARPGAYAFDSARRGAREREAARATAAGPRTYNHRGAPDMTLVDPKKRLATRTKNPLVVAVDVTGSMSHWPAEIFDRLPLLYNTLSQYRPDLEVCFAAIGDAACDRWPLQVTRFASGFDLETQLKALHGEGGGGDEPESYELFAYWLDQHVTLGERPEEKPFLIVFGDAPMHPKVRKNQVDHYLGDTLGQDQDAIATWQRVTENWNAWFLRRQGTAGDRIDAQWTQALGQQIIHIEDELRAVDYAMGLVARNWGHFDDFQANMAARQADGAIGRVVEGVEAAVRRRERTSRRRRTTKAAS